MANNIISVLCKESLAKVGTLFQKNNYGILSRQGVMTLEHYGTPIVNIMFNERPIEVRLCEGAKSVSDVKAINSLLEVLEIKHKRAKIFQKVMYMTNV